MAKEPLSKRRYSAKETCNLKESMNHYSPPNMTRDTLNDAFGYGIKSQRCRLKSTSTLNFSLSLAHTVRGTFLPVTFDQTKMGQITIVPKDSKSYVFVLKDSKRNLLVCLCVR